MGRPSEVALAYPSPYRAGMSSLGFQTLYRILHELGIGAHRAFLPDAWEPMALTWPQPRRPILTYEAERPLSSYRIVGLSMAYELEIAGVIRLLEGAGIPLLAKDRRAGRSTASTTTTPRSTRSATFVTPTSRWPPTSSPTRSRRRS